MISGRRERTCGQHCQEVGSKKESPQGKGTCKHRKNVHFCHLQGRKPLTPTPPAGGSLRGHRPQKGAQAKKKDNACHMRIELTRERYATLCAKAKKSGLTKQTPIARLLARGEIGGHENSAARRPERVRRFCKAVPGNPPELWEERFCGFQQKRSRCSADRLVRIKTNRSWQNRA